MNAYHQRSGELAERSILLSRLEQGDAIAQSVVNEWGRYLSWGVRGLVGVLNPERIVFGRQLAVLVPHVQDQLDEMLLC